MKNSTKNISVIAGDDLLRSEASITFESPTYVDSLFSQILDIPLGSQKDGFEGAVVDLLDQSIIRLSS